MATVPFCTTPAEAAGAALRAWEAGDADALLALVHSDGFEEFGRAVRTTATMERMRRGMADVAAAEEAPRGSLVGSIFGVGSAEEAAALPPRELFARYLAVVFQRAPDACDPAGSLPEPRAVLGVVDGGDGMAYAVFRESQPELSLFAEAPRWHRRARVLTVRREGDGGWKVMLDGGIFFDEAGTFGFAGGWEEEGDPADPYAAGDGDGR
jgi:hypothetical protein